MFKKLTPAERDDLAKDPKAFCDRYTPEWLEYGRMTDEEIMANADKCFEEERFMTTYLLLAELLKRNLKK
jgi:hypothetical protein